MIVQRWISVENRQVERQKHYKTYCQNHGDLFTYGNDTISRLSRRPEGLIVSDKHRILYCPIPKIGFSHWIKIMIYLNTDVNFDDLLLANYSTLYNLYNDR